MDEYNRRRRRAIARTGLLAALGLALGFGSCSPARAQGLVSFALPGVFLPSAGEGRNALGTTKFYHEGTLFRKSISLVAVRVSLGLDVITASSGYFPFTGGSELDLVGPGARLSATRLVGRFQPFVAVGAYAGRLKSDRLGIEEWKFTPGAAAGLDIRIAGPVRLRAQYRVIREIAGVSVNGAAVSLRL